jgi:protein-S-isoprenylcysteine O-methyltransferase Ste14/pimeloyl-ACP methyl ester carboxylesterase
MLLRALLAFVALPGLVAFVAPLLLARQAPGEGSFRWIALLLLLPGIALLLWCVREFYVHGKGTIAPWHPPRDLVTSGLYRVSRNPMYLAVSLILFGWAVAFPSLALLVYAIAVMAAFHLRVVLHEEPLLARVHREGWQRYSARVPRWLFPTRRAVVYTWLAFLVLLPVGGLIYEAYADGMGAREFPPPGMLVDIGGRRLHLLCIGEGEPTVFFLSSGWGSAVSSSRARERIAARTTVCSYDRSGMGWSDPGPRVASTGDLARDLAVLQDRAKLHGPHILVPSSIGGLTAELFARQFPERVAGLVFVDAANSRQLSLREYEYASRWLTPAACASSILAHFGVIRLLDPFGLQQEMSDGARRGIAITYNSRLWTQLCAMARGLPETVREFEQAPPLRTDLPLTVLSASSAEGLAPPSVARFVNVEELRDGLRASHQQFAKQSTRGKWLLVPDSTHLIGSSQPDAVADAVLEMLEALR